MTEEEYQIRIHELEKQVARLQSEIKRNSETNYGLRWMDVPEAFDAESENKIPTLEEVKELAINNNDGKPTHILIEGDNYHALTCLNYTHKGKIDVIYIDPPYNTGSDGFVYKDKRILDKFPDGTTVPTDHPLRHSYWLSFMEKRLRLAKNLLSKTGVIFISIDDNEYANLKLLCDKTFGENNFIATFKWNRVNKAPSLSLSVRTKFEYVLAYRKRAELVKLYGKDSYNSAAPLYNISNQKHILEFAPGTIDCMFDDGTYCKGKYGAGEKSVELINDLIVTDGKNENSIRINAKFKWVQSTLDERVNKGQRFAFKKPNFTTMYYYIDNDGQKYIPPSDLISDEECGVKTNLDASDRLKEMGINFDYSKPISLIQFLLNMVCHTYKEAIILDFFAGSGTTMHATMALNAEDKGHRQCILVQMQEKSNICTRVTYERNKKAMCGYTNIHGQYIEGFGGSMKYYRTSFVGEHTPSDASDFDKTLLAQKAGCLLALSENNLEEIVTANSYQIFALRDGDKATNDCKYTAVYFSGNLMDFPKLRQEIEQLQAQYNHPKIAIYVFCWGDASIMLNEFDDTNNLVVKDIPQPILDIYTKLNA